MKFNQSLRSPFCKRSNADDEFTIDRSFTNSRSVAEPSRPWGRAYFQMNHALPRRLLLPVSFLSRRPHGPPVRPEASAPARLESGGSLLHASCEDREWRRERRATSSSGAASWLGAGGRRNGRHGRAGGGEAPRWAGGIGGGELPLVFFFFYSNFLTFFYPSFFLILDAKIFLLIFSIYFVKLFSSIFSISPIFSLNLSISSNFSLKNSSTSPIFFNIFIKNNDKITKKEKRKRWEDRS